MVDMLIRYDARTDNPRRQNRQERVTRPLTRYIDRSRKWQLETVFDVKEAFDSWTG